jgi:group I intron endonuclease
MKFMVEKEDKNKSGIYFITNDLDNKFYLGRTHDFKERNNGHNTQLNRGSDSILLQRWADKYGKQYLNFFIREFVDVDILVEVEQIYLDRYKGSPDSLNSTFRTEISNAGGHLTKEHREKIGNSNRGKVISLEQRKKLSESRKGMKFSKKHCESMSKSRMGKGPPMWVNAMSVLAKSIPVVQLSLTGEYIKTFPSIASAEEEMTKHLNLKQKRYSGSIGRVCRGKHKTTYKFKWMYAKDYKGEKN